MMLFIKIALDIMFQ